MNLRERVAFHEAGHAVVAHLLGRRVLAVEVEDDPDSWRPGATAGRVQVDAIPVPFNPSRLTAAERKSFESEAIVALAGRVAEARFMNLPGGVLDEDDAATFARAARYLRPPNLTRFRAEAAQLADDYVRRHFELIRVVARALLESSFLTGTEFRRLVKDATNGKEM